MELRRARWVAALIAGSAGLAACGGGGAAVAPSTTAATTPSPTTAVRSYLSEGANDVYWMQLTTGTNPTGIFEMLLGPAAAPDGRTTDWVYRLRGTVTGTTLTYGLTPISPEATPIPGVLTSSISAESVTVAPPVTAVAVVMDSATQREYNLAARRHATSWNGSSG